MHNTWCPDHTVCIDWIDQKASILVENFQDVDTVYMSFDIYAQFLKTLRSSFVGHQPISGGFEIVEIVVSVGRLIVKPVAMLENFCFVGSAQTYDSLVRAQIDQAFEDVVMQDFDRV